MSNYKRLTTKDKDGNWQVWEDDYSHPFEALQVAIDRLAELEDKIEQGTLIELNDKLIGENVYGIQQDTTGKYWFDDDENIVLGFTSDGIVTWNNSHGYNDWFKNGLWFLSREEAEKRLKELQNG